MNFRIQRMLRFSMLSLLILVSVVAVVLVNLIISPVHKSELIGHWSCNCEMFADNQRHWYYKDHIDVELGEDGGYDCFVKGLFYVSKGESDDFTWNLNPVVPTFGRYALSFGGNSKIYPVRFSRDHRTMFISVNGAEEPLTKSSE